MYNIKKTIRALVLVLVVVFSLGIGAMAGGVITQVTAYTNANVDIVLNGEAFVPTNPDGSELPILVYDNRTYLPVRAIGEAMGLKVDWNADTETVILGEDPNLVKATSLGFSTAIDATTKAPTNVSKTFKTDVAKVYNVVNLDTVKANTKLNWTWYFDGEVIFETSTTTVDVMTDLNAYSAIYFAEGKVFAVGTYTVEVTGTYYGKEVFSITDSFEVVE